MLNGSNGMMRHKVRSKVVLADISVPSSFTAFVPVTNLPIVRPLKINSLKKYSKSQPVLLQKQLKSKGLDVKLIEFDPLETAPLAKDSPNPDPGYYLQKMRENIEALAKALP